MDKEKLLEEEFLIIKNVYKEYEIETLKEGKKLVRDTHKGIYGVSDCDKLFLLFKEIGLSNDKRFIDLGCGDGRAVLIASLFTDDASGIEADEELAAVGIAIAKRLKLPANIKCGDFLSTDLTGYDVLFINPDQGFHKGLDKKLASEIKGTLYVYNEIFSPNHLKKGKKHWFGQLPVVEYNRK
jgi:hypothetical protein